jgi:hypothetical protein
MISEEICLMFLLPLVYASGDGTATVDDLSEMRKVFIFRAKLTSRLCGSNSGFSTALVGPSSSVFWLFILDCFTCIDT